MSWLRVSTHPGRSIIAASSPNSTCVNATRCPSTATSRSVGESSTLPSRMTVGGWGPISDTTEEGFDAGDELTRAERFHEVIISADAKPTDAVWLVASRAQEEDWNNRSGADGSPRRSRSHPCQGASRRGSRSEAAVRRTNVEGFSPVRQRRRDARHSPGTPGRHRTSSGHLPRRGLANRGRSLSPSPAGASPDCGPVRRRCLHGHCSPFCESRRDAVRRGTARHPDKAYWYGRCWFSGLEYRGERKAGCRRGKTTRSRFVDCPEVATGRYWCGGDLGRGEDEEPAAAK